MLRAAWSKEIKVAGKRLGFEHNFPPEVVKKRKEYIPLKRILKQEGISFQSPYTKVRVHWDDGMKVYESAAEAAREIRERGYKEKTRTQTRGSDSPTGDAGTLPLLRPEMPGEEAIDEKERRRKEAVAKWQRVLRKKTGENASRVARKKDKGQERTKT